MKKNIFRAAAMATLAILCILINIPFSERSNTKIFTLPGLPRPIAKAPVVITSAGQSTDTYIIHDISNQLMIRSFFMPQAEDIDIKDIKTIVFSVDYSSLGTKYKDISYDEEKKRINKLIKKAKDKELTVLTIVLGGKQPHEKKTEELLRLIGNQTDYFIGLRGSGNEEILTELAENRDIPLTLVDGVNDISEPYASAFR
jgi:hypothetical protein